LNGNVELSAKALNPKAPNHHPSRPGWLRPSHAQLGRRRGHHPEHEAALMTGRMIAKYHPVLTSLQ
jgi:hypothetical protein